MNGKSIIFLIPEILKYIIYEDQKYIIDPSKKEFIGKFFTNTKNLNETFINNILDKIKEHRQLLFMYENKNRRNSNNSINILRRKTESNIDYMDFTEIYNFCKDAGELIIPINFTVIMKSFFKDKYIFFKFFIERNDKLEVIINHALLNNSSLNFSNTQKISDYKNKNKIIKTIKNLNDKVNKVASKPISINGIYGNFKGNNDFNKYQVKTNINIYKTERKNNSFLEKIEKEKNSINNSENKNVNLFEFKKKNYDLTNINEKNAYIKNFKNDLKKLSLNMNKQKSQRDKNLGFDEINKKLDDLYKKNKGENQTETNEDKNQNNVKEEIKKEEIKKEEIKNEEIKEN
jgi:hypothetical protein